MKVGTSWRVADFDCTEGRNVFYKQTKVAIALKSEKVNHVAIARLIALSPRMALLVSMVLDDEESWENIKNAASEIARNLYPSNQQL